MNKSAINPCILSKRLTQPHLRRRVRPVLSAIGKGGGGSSHKDIRIHAIVTGDSDGTHTAATNHQDFANKICGFKYKIQKADIKKLVDGANQVFLPASINFLFDQDKDVEFINETLLNRDTLTPADAVVDTQHVFYRDANGNIQMLFAGETWQSKNLTQAASTTAASGSPAVYKTGASTIKHVVYRGVDGHIHELFGGDNWQSNVLTAIANAPAAAGNPFGYTTYEGATGAMDLQHVVYRGIDGHVHELFAGETWQHNVLTALAGAPPAAGDPFGYVTFNPATGRLDLQHVVYRSSDGRIHELFAGETWQHNVLTETQGAPLAVGDPFAYTTSYGDVQHIVYRGVDGHIHELFAGSTWQHNNLTALTGAPQAAGNPAGYTTNDYDFGILDVQHVVYRGVDAHIHELFTLETWQHNDLTATANAPVAASDPTAYTDGGKQTQHVIYRDSQGHIQELFAGEQWTVSDLTNQTQAPLGSMRPFGYFVASDELCGITRNRTALEHRGKLVVYFRYGWGGWSNSVDEFVVMPSIWNPNDLGFMAHEIGHYLHLPHSFIDLSPDQAKSEVEKYVKGLAAAGNNNKLPPVIPDNLINRGLEVLDADRPLITDTPAELQADGTDPCNLKPQIADIKVSFSATQSKVYKLNPDSLNVMNYVSKGGKTAHLSKEQIARMRNAIEQRNRQHLV